MSSLRGPFGWALVTICCACWGRSLALGANPDADLVVHELCGKRIALLGESPSHGYGRTLQFKVELVRRLIDECHYNAFFIESGIYDFLNFRKKLKSGQVWDENFGWIAAKHVARYRQGERFGGNFFPARPVGSGWGGLCSAACAG